MGPLVKSQSVRHSYVLPSISILKSESRISHLSNRRVYATAMSSRRFLYLSLSPALATGQIAEGTQQLRPPGDLDT